MANELGFYNPLFYANEALIHLESALGMAGRVHLGFDEERRTFDRGDTINIRKPSTFTTQAAPGNAMDVATENVSITLNDWREVRFKLSDKELSYTGERIINEHIRPAAYALADYIDQQLTGLYVDIPYWATHASGDGMTVADVVAVRKDLFDRKVPLDTIHCMVDGAMEADLLGLTAFTNWQGSAQAGVDAQLRGHLGTRYGMEFFANQNVKTHVGGSLTGTPLLDGGGNPVPAGTSTLTFDAGSLTGTVKAGDTLTIAGNGQRYSVTADATAAGNAITISISPATVVQYADNAQGTFVQTGHTAGLAFHPNFAALAMARLPDFSNRTNRLGQEIASVQHPKSGVAIRSRIFADGTTSSIQVVLDVLFGVKTLDPSLATRVRRT